MNVYIFGNGNISFEDFKCFYQKPLEKVLEDKKVTFIICDYKGVDTLTMEFLKDKTSEVCLLHIGDKPRYFPDKYRTKVSSWKVIGGFEDDISRDEYAIENCSHFIAKDFNSNDTRKSGTFKNIEKSLEKNRIQLF